MTNEDSSGAEILESDFDIYHEPPQEEHEEHEEAVRLVKSLVLFRFDAFGNALGNSVAGKHRAAADKAIERQQINPINKAWLTAGADAKTPSTIVSPLTAADDPSNWNWDEEDIPVIEKKAIMKERLVSGSVGKPDKVKYDMSGYSPIINWKSRSSTQKSGLSIDTTSLTAVGLTLAAGERMAANGWGSYLGGYKSYSLLGGADTPMELVELRLSIGKYSDIPITSPINTTLFKEGFIAAGDFTTKLGLGATIANATIDGFQGDLDMSKSVKYVVDAAAATSTLSKAGYLTRFSPLGIAYSGLDLANSLKVTKLGMVTAQGRR